MLLFVRTTLSKKIKQEVSKVLPFVKIGNKKHAGVSIYLKEFFVKQSTKCSEGFNAYI